jgi:hypothetical protein
MYKAQTISSAASMELMLLVNAAGKLSGTDIVSVPD